MTGAVLDGGTGHSQSGNIGQRIQIGSAGAITNPKPLLTRSLKAGIVPLTFGTQSVSLLELMAFPFNGKMVVGGNGFVLDAAPFFLSLFQFLWLQGQQPVLDWRKGQQNFWHPRPLSKILLSLCMTSPASQIEWTEGSLSEFLVLRLFKGITASPS